MNWNLFLDDERMPVDDSDTIARSYDEAVQLVTEYGLPDNIRFDHDLGNESKSGYDFAVWLAEYCCDELEAGKIPEFEFTVHSQNPIGAQNITALLNNLKKIIRNTKES